MNPNNIILKFLSDRLGRSATKLELEPRIKTIGGKLPDLTESEKIDIKALWHPIASDRLNFDYWRFYKAMSDGKVSASFVPDNIYWSRVIRALNPASITRTYINKSLYPIIFKGLRQPEVLVNVINGIPYDANMKLLRRMELSGILKSFGGDVIIKPTTATSGGRGVSIISSSSSLSDIDRRLSSYGLNYICQGVVEQSPFSSVFNDSSLNTFRVNTLNLNSKVTCECLMMRHGIDGSVVDNFAVGGVVCGMTKDGRFNGNNYNTKLERLNTLRTGEAYIDVSIPSINKVIETAIDAHQKYMPHIGHAAWDFAININEEPVMIEVNLMLPGILMEQLTSGDSIFGERTEEVIQYAFSKNKRLSWTEFVGGWG